MFVLQVRLQVIFARKTPRTNIAQKRLLSRVGQKMSAPFGLIQELFLAIRTRVELTAPARPSAPEQAPVSILSAGGGVLDDPAGQRGRASLAFVLGAKIMCGRRALAGNL